MFKKKNTQSPIAATLACGLLIAAGSSPLAMVHGASSYETYKASDFPSIAHTNSVGKAVSAHPLHTPLGIRGFNPFLEKSEIINDASLEGTDCVGRPTHATCADYPAIASGLTMGHYDKDGSVVFYGISDRGPNQDCGDLSDAHLETGAVKTALVGSSPAPADGLGSGKGFPVPKFAPTIATLTLSGDRANVVNTCYLKRTDLSPITGVSTNVADDAPRDAWCQTTLAYDEGGQDAEDLQAIPGTNPPLGVIVDEYNPSVSIVNIDWESPSCGVILARYVPEDTVTTTEGAGYPIKKILPKSWSQRRKNRGLENVAVSPDGKTVIAIMQSAMDVKDATYFNETAAFDTRDAEFVVAAVLNITDPVDAKLVSQKYYPIDTDWRAASGLDKVKMSAAWWMTTDYGVGENKEVLIMLERDTSVRLYMTDFEAATPVDEAVWPAAFLHTLTTKAAVTERTGIQFAKKQLILDTATLEGYGDMTGATTKVEGFAVVNDCAIVMANDNDFGLEGNTATSLVVAQLGKCLKAIAEDMGYTYTPPVPTVSPASSLKSSLVGVATAFAVVFAALL